MIKQSALARSGTGDWSVSSATPNNRLGVCPPRGPPKPRPSSPSGPELLQKTSRRSGGYECVSRTGACRIAAQVPRTDGSSAALLAGKCGHILFCLATPQLPFPITAGGNVIRESGKSRRIRGATTSPISSPTGPVCPSIGPRMAMSRDSRGLPAIRAPKDNLR